MRCDVVGNAPFVIRASALSEIPLLTSLDSAEGMFAKLFLDLKYAGYTVSRDYRVAQLNFKPEIELSYMLFERSLSIFSMPSLKHLQFPE